LCLLNNLEGSGTAGQLTPDDASMMLDILLSGKSLVLVDLPLYPAGILGSVAARCVQVALVVRGTPASTAALRSALALMERSGVDTTRVGIIATGCREEDGLDYGHEMLAVVPDEASPDAPAYREIAGRFHSLTRALAEEST
jgi:hypothetical protein